MLRSFSEGLARIVTLRPGTMTWMDPPHRLRSVLLLGSSGSIGIRPMPPGYLATWSRGGSRPCRRSWLVRSDV